MRDENKVASAVLKAQSLFLGRMFGRRGGRWPQHNLRGAYIADG